MENDIWNGRPLALKVQLTFQQIWLFCWMVIIDGRYSYVCMYVCMYVCCWLLVKGCFCWSMLQQQLSKCSAYAGMCMLHGEGVALCGAWWVCCSVWCMVSVLLCMLHGECVAFVCCMVSVWCMVSVLLCMLHGECVVHGECVALCGVWWVCCSVCCMVSVLHVVCVALWGCSLCLFL